MKINCRVSELNSGLQAALRAVSGRATLPILRNVKLEAASDNELILTATDMNFSIQRKVPAVVEKTGETTVEAKMLSEVIGSFPEGEVSVQQEGDQLAVRCFASEHFLPTIPADEFPLIPELTESETFTLHQSTLKRLILRTVFAASSDPTSGVCQGVLVEAEKDNIAFVATDTHRLAISKAKLKSQAASPVSAIVPASVLREVARLLEGKEDAQVRVAIDSAHVQFETETTLCVCLRLQGQFPNYKRVIPKSFARKVEADAQAFLQATRRAQIHAPQHSKRVVFRIQRDLMLIESEAPEAGRGKEEVKVNLEGEPINIAFQAPFITEFLSAVEGNGVILELNENYQAAALKPKEDGNDFLYVVMPMQLPEE